MVSVLGRDRELARFGELIDEAAAGAGRVVAVGGEAGVGKSRLAAEFLETARRRGLLTLRGIACVYQTGLSYAPVVEALRPLVRAEPLPPELADLGRLFGGLTAPAPPALEDPGLQRTRLFEAIIELVRRTTVDQPVVLLADDVHWADASSLDVLHYLGRAVAQLPCLVVLTYRPAEAEPGLRTMLSSLRRGEWLVEMPLGPLHAPELAALAGELLGDSPPAPLLEVLASKAGGVPLFVRELIAALRAGGQLFRSGRRWVLGPGAADTVPSSVAELFEQRVGSLDPADRAILEAVSVCGDAATPDIVDAVCPDSVDRLDRLRANGFIVEDCVDGEVVHRTVHPLLAEAVYEQMPVRYRQRCHAAAAEAVGSTDLSRLAHHIGRAGSAVEPATALAALCAATEHAVVRRAGEEGVRHARNAITLARRLDQADLVPGLLAKLAESASCAGLTDEAVRAWRAAAAAGDRVSCLLRLAQVETDCGRLEDARAHLDEATALVAADAVEPRVDIAQVGLVLHTRAGDQKAVLAAVEELERIAADPGHRRARALARYARLELTGYGVGTVAEAEADAAIQEVSEVAGVPLIASLELISMGTAVGRGEHAVVARRVQQSIELVRAGGLPVLEVIPTAFWALAQYQAGAWDSALALADHALVLAHRVALPRGVALALAVRAMVLVQRGEAAEARSCVEEAASYYRDRRIGRMLGMIGAQLALARGQAAWAVELAAAEGPFAVPVPHLQTRAEACRLTGAHDEVARLVDELDALGFPYARALADRLRGDRESVSRAAAALDALALPFDAAGCHLDLAELLADVDQPAAIKAATRAMAVFDDLGAAPYANRARRLLRKLGVRPKPRERPAGTLSTRETEIAQLVAQGLSNAAIAHQLFLSPRTVTTQLERIYRRLGLSSRHELARYVTAAASNT